jgi:hypothetical protein
VLTDISPLIDNADMQIRDIEGRYESWAAAAKAIGISPQLMSKLKKSNKEIPIEYQIKWEVATNGELKADIPEQIRQREMQ